MGPEPNGMDPGIKYRGDGRQSLPEQAQNPHSTITLAPIFTRS